MAPDCNICASITSLCQNISAFGHEHPIVSFILLAVLLLVFNYLFPENPARTRDERQERRWRRQAAKAARQKS